MCFGNGLRGDPLPDIDASTPMRAVSIVGRPSPTYSDDPARTDRERRASMPASQGTLAQRNAAALAAFRKIKGDNVDEDELMTQGRNVGDEPTEEVRRKGSYSRYLS